jgi:hypothetical protein
LKGNRTVYHVRGNIPPEGIDRENYCQKGDSSSENLICNGRFTSLTLPRKSVLEGEWPKHQ